MTLMFQFIGTLTLITLHRKRLLSLLLQLRRRDMGTFTVSLREMIDMDEVIFLSDEASKYPIFDEAYRPKLNKKIIEHYMMYEIGQETMGQFRFALNRKMREIMPYYNQLYKTVQNEIDPFKTMDYSDDSISHQTG